MDSAAEIESNYANDNEPTQASVSPNNWWGSKTSKNPITYAS